MTWEIFLLLSLLGIKHFFADFVFQTEYMVKEKGIYGALGGIHHSGIHAVGTLAVLASVSPLAILLALADGVAHYHIDWAKQQLNQGYTPKDKLFWFYIGLDQCLHYLTYMGIVYVATS